jgi:NADH-quinone oxidoreductase subunit A
MYPWAVNFMGWIKSSSALAMDMFIEMIVFMGLLLVGFIYVIKKGVLTWEK